MSFDIMARVWWRVDCTSTEKLVALSLADQASEETAKCWPSKGYVATRCCLTPRSVQNVLRSLEQKGWIRVEERKKQSNVYYFVLENLPHKTPEQTFEAVHFREIKGEGRSPQGEDDDLFREKDVLPGGEGRSPRNLIESKEETPTNLYAKKDVEKTFEEAWKILSAHHPKVPSILLFDDTRKRELHFRIKDWSSDKRTEDATDLMARLFTIIHQSHFLTGRAPRTPDFSVTVDWVLNKRNFKKIMEVNYDQKGNRPVESHERDVGAAARDAADAIRRRREQRGGSPSQYPT